VSAKTTHIITVSTNITQVVLAPTWLYILSFIKIHFGVSEV